MAAEVEAVATSGSRRISPRVKLLGATTAASAAEFPLGNGRLTAPGPSSVEGAVVLPASCPALSSRALLWMTRNCSAWLAIVEPDTRCGRT